MASKKIGYRIESDSLGKVKVPKDALYGAQTQRAINNFKISWYRFDPIFIESLAALKAACAIANRDCKVLQPKIARAISLSAREISTNIECYYEQFPIDIFQTGSGTSTNMNMNEVLSTLASRRAKLKIHPNDDVNKSQSSNDVIPTCINISSVLLAMELYDVIDFLIMKLIEKEWQYKDVIKTGRTHLMDAVPLSLGFEIESWREQLVHANESLNIARSECQFLPIGGTAIGTGLNAPKSFSKNVCKELNTLFKKQKIKFSPNANKSEMISSQNHILGLSSSLLRISSCLIKISNDLRWMNSGPVSGLSEIKLKALQPGSSIMPGKINPVIPEAVIMASTQVTGNHSCIINSCQSSSFQLNTMLPLIAHNIIESFNLLISSAMSLTNTIESFEVNHSSIKDCLDRNPIIATKLNEVIGYDEASAIVKEAYKTNKPIIEIAEKRTELTKKDLKKLLDPKKLA